ncbi:hypothetical protein FB107DRAFT_252770 [Schizophyllum commune]
MVVVTAGPKNAKSTPIVPRSAPVPLSDRCDTGVWWAGGEERRGAPLCYNFLRRSGRRNSCDMTPIALRLAPRVLVDSCDLEMDERGGASRPNCARPRKCKIDVKCAEVRAGASRLQPRHELSITYGRWRICATSSAERCLASSNREVEGAARSAAWIVVSSYLVGILPERVVRSLLSAFEHSFQVLYCSHERANEGSPCLKLCRASQELIHDLQRLLQDLSGSEATYRRPASEELTDITIPPPFSPILSSRPLPTASGDE